MQRPGREKRHEAAQMILSGEAGEIALSEKGRKSISNFLGKGKEKRAAGVKAT